MKVVAIIQARMGATRLPNKMMLHLHGYPICEWVFRRVSSAKHIDNVVFALPDTSQDDLLEKFLNSIGPAIKNARRSLVAQKNIPKGKIIEESDLTFKRPADGVSPRFIDEIIGKKAIANIKEDTILKWNMFDD